MQIILAESLDGWLFGGFLMLGGLFAVIARIGCDCSRLAATPTSRITLAAPALIVVVLVTLWATYEYFTIGVGDPDMSFSDFAAPWCFLAGPSFCAGVLAMVVLLFRGRRGMSRAGQVSERGGGEIIPI